MSVIVEDARRTAGGVASRMAPEARAVRGVWVNQYCLQLNDAASMLALQYLIVQGERQGCCYFDGPILGVSGPSLIGRDLLTLRDTTALEIAALDALLLADPGTPLREWTLTGSPGEKAAQRARHVVAEAHSLVDAGAGRPRVLVVGVVGDFLALLRELPCDVVATDFSPSVVGQTIHGVCVLDGSHTLDEVARADLALVTGMTLSNGTLDSIMAVARGHDTELVMYCQTGAGFAPLLRAAGAARVISEPHPFYLTADGPSLMRVY